MPLRRGAQLEEIGQICLKPALGGVNGYTTGKIYATPRRVFDKNKCLQHRDASEPDQRVEPFHDILSFDLSLLLSLKSFPQ